jgi:hypothetical protein
MTAVEGMRSVPGAVATGSSIDAAVEFPKEAPVATAPGTDLILKSILLRIV